MRTPSINSSKAPAGSPKKRRQYSSQLSQPPFAVRHRSGDDGRSSETRLLLPKQLLIIPNRINPNPRRDFPSALTKINNQEPRQDYRGRQHQQHHDRRFHLYAAGGSGGIGMGGIGGMRMGPSGGLGLLAILICWPLLPSIPPTSKNLLR